ncbi:hypothetical protein, partial [Burkholderia stagnalis]|uniref:hypothetical protein n=1 Tax=Burkholderia stagnalis TaxID=1503054 RepID=UPI001C8974CC
PDRSERGALCDRLFARSITPMAYRLRSYSKTIAARMKLFEEMVGEFNARQQQMKRLVGGAFTITIDDGPVLDSSLLVGGVGGTAIVKAAPQYEVDRKFLKLGQSGRLNHFAQEYGFANFDKFREFLGLLDAEAQAMGYPSYSAICVPTRYLEHLQCQLMNDVDMQSTLAELMEKRDLLQQQCKRSTCTVCS